MVKIALCYFQFTFGFVAFQFIAENNVRRVKILRLGILSEFLERNFKQKYALLLLHSMPETEVNS